MVIAIAPGGEPAVAPLDDAGWLEVSGVDLSASRNAAGRCSGCVRCWPLCQAHEMVAGRPWGAGWGRLEPIRGRGAGGGAVALSLRHGEPGGAVCGGRRAEAAARPTVGLGLTFMLGMLLADRPTVLSTRLIARSRQHARIASPSFGARRGGMSLLVAALGHAMALPGVGGGAKARSLPWGLAVVGVIFVSFILVSIWLAIRRRRRWAEPAVFACVAVR